MKNKKGLSLLEVIIVVAIIGIMSSISIVSFSKAKLRSSVETAAEKAIAVIREAQNYALTGKEVSTLCHTYSVNFTPSTGSFLLTNGGLCSLNKNYVLEDGVVFSSVGVVSFTAPHADTSGLSVIRVQKGGYFCDINVNSIGLITKSCS